MKRHDVCQSPWLFSSQGALDLALGLLRSALDLALYFLRLTLSLAAEFLGRRLDAANVGLRARSLVGDFLGGGSYRGGWHV